jgi:hypothetical protein
MGELLFPLLCSTHTIAHHHITVTRENAALRDFNPGDGC